MATKYRRQQSESAATDWARWLVLLVLVGGLAWYVFFGHPAKAAAQAPAVPTLTSFFYKTPSGADMEVVSWFSDGIKCTMIRPRGLRTDDKGMALSCVSVLR